MRINFLTLIDSASVTFCTWRKRTLPEDEEPPGIESELALRVEQLETLYINENILKTLTARL